MGFIGEKQGEGSGSSQPFGDRMETYFKNRYPIAGGLANAVFGGPAEGPQNTQPVGQGFNLPPVPIDTGTNMDTSLLAMNAQPKQGGGLSLLKALTGAA